MSVDVVCCYYKQRKYLEHFTWGIEQNIEEIDRVFLCNDEPWDDEETNDIIEALCYVGADVYFTDHSHAGPGTHGVARCFNEGIAAAKGAKYVFLTSFDQVLTPGTLADVQELARPGRMVLGRVDSIHSSTSVDDLSDPTILRKDVFDAAIPTLRANPGRVIIGAWRNGHTLIHRASHNKIGGFDERFVQWGYGLEDQDYAIRWLLEFGRDSIVWSDSSSWHFAGDKPSIEDPAKAAWNPIAVKAVNDNLYRLYVKNDIRPEHRHYFQYEEGKDA